MQSITNPSTSKPEDSHSNGNSPTGHVFKWETDTMAFANQTVWRYGKDDPSSDAEKLETFINEAEPIYARRCFVLSESAVQFFKFARFDSSLPPLDDVELAKHIRAIRRIGVWRSPLPDSQRIELPGYNNLREISGARSEVFRKNLGAGWTTYFRPGNHRIVMPVTRAGQDRVFRSVQRSLARGIPHGLWLINFPSLNINHATLVLNAKPLNAERWEMQIYDPNFTRSVKKLEYDLQTRTFYFQKTFYFPGGPVNVRALYQRPLQ